jgi:Uma2 family endonuclease
MASGSPSLGPKPWTVDEFLAWERDQAERYELVDGVVRMMTGGSNAHAAVKGNLFAALRGLVKAPCRVFVDGPKVVTATASLYPDVLVTCAPVVMSDDTVHEPRLIAEVLSRTTAHHDRSTKWLAYREIASLAHYLLVWQDRAQVELFSRQEGGGWALAIVEAPALLRLEALGVELDIGQLYEGLEA